MLGWFRKKKTETVRETYKPRPLTEVAARMMVVCDPMDKHTLSHCIVSLVADRAETGEMTEGDISLLILRLKAITPMSQTPRPERK